MSYYFSYFPTVQHDLTNVGQKVALTNIIRRFKIQSSLLTDTRVYYDYEIQAGDRPDTIADKYYGDSGYAWLVLLFNEIDDPVFGWPIFNYDFDQYIKGKYGGIPAAQAQIHEYREVLNDKEIKYDGTIIEKRTVVIDQTTYSSLAEEERESISKWDWELEENERKRKIKILNERYLQNVKKQIKSILKDGV